MGYKLRFIQKFSQKDKRRFLDLEKEFIRFERNNFDMPKGRRYITISGKEPSNTLIWECEFETMEELIKQLNAIHSNEEHEKLLQKQMLFIKDSYTEILEEFSL